jgi:hypothetical protein
MFTAAEARWPSPWTKLPSGVVRVKTVPELPPVLVHSPGKALVEEVERIEPAQIGSQECGQSAATGGWLGGEQSELEGRS